MKPLEVFEAMQEGLQVVIKNKEYLLENEIENNTYTISSIYSDGICTVIDENYNIYSELTFDDINLKK